MILLLAIVFLFVVWHHFELMAFNIFDEFQSLSIIVLNAQIIPMEPSPGCLLSPVDTIPEIFDNFLDFWYNFFLTFLIWQLRSGLPFPLWIFMYLIGCILTLQLTSTWDQAGGRVYSIERWIVNQEPCSLILPLTGSIRYPLIFSGSSFLPYQIGGGGYTSIIFTFLSHIKMLKS